MFVEGPPYHIPYGCCVSLSYLMYISVVVIVVVNCNCPVMDYLL